MDLLQPKEMLYSDIGQYGAQHSNADSGTQVSLREVDVKSAHGRAFDPALRMRLRIHFPKVCPHRPFFGVSYSVSPVVAVSKASAGRAKDRNLN